MWRKIIPTWHFHSIIIYLPFSQYNHIQNFEEKKLFQHFANLIKIRSTHLLPILDLIIPLKQGELWSNAHLWYPFHFPWYGVPIWSLWPNTRFLPSIVVEKNVLYPRSPKGEGVYCFTSVRPSKIFFVTFFSATIDGRNLIFGHKLHIGMPYRGKRFCIWLYCENGKYMIILWKCQVRIYFFLLSSQIVFFKIQNQNNF
jgi:hypothetical protein